MLLKSLNSIVFIILYLQKKHINLKRNHNSLHALFHFTQLKKKKIIIISYSNNLKSVTHVFCTREAPSMETRPEEKTLIRSLKFPKQHHLWKKKIPKKIKKI